MDEKKQIEEMAKVIDEFTEPLSARDIHKAEFSERFAKHLYDANYRKQSELIDEFAKRLKGRNKVYCVNEKDLKEMNFVVDQIANEMKGSL